VGTAGVTLAWHLVRAGRQLGFSLRPVLGLLWVTPGVGLEMEMERQ